MDLKRFDNQCVRITTTTGEVFEGVVSYCNREYVFHEYGYDQEALHLVPVLLCKDDIAGVESLENVNGPYGHFSEKYGFLEKKCLEWGTDMIEEVFDSEDDIQQLRMLACLNDNFQSLTERTVEGMAPWRLKNGMSEPKEENNEQGPIYKGELEKMLHTLVKYSENDEVVKEAKELLERFEKHFS